MEDPQKTGSGGCVATVFIFLGVIVLALLWYFRI
jgi:hypothetical protein